MDHRRYWSNSVSHDPHVLVIHGLSVVRIGLKRARQHTLLSVHCQSRLRFRFHEYCVACNYDNNYDNDYFNDKDDDDICQREFNSNRLEYA